MESRLSNGIKVEMVRLHMHMCTHAQKYTTCVHVCKCTHLSTILHQNAAKGLIFFFWVCNKLTSCNSAMIISLDREDSFNAFGTSGTLWYSAVLALRFTGILLPLCTSDFDALSIFTE